MVNYCCVYGCGRNSRNSKLLMFYCLPKDTNRQMVWLQAACRDDLLLAKPEQRIRSRFCSRHFEPSSIKNKHLCADAVPTKCLPGSWSDEDVDSTVQQLHQNIVCNSCNGEILGFRYKCVTCPDYDLCPKCEMLEIHPEHFVIRIPQPLKFKAADKLSKKWRRFLNAERVMYTTDNSPENDSSDDEPITKYAKNYDSGIDLSEDTKSKIRDEVTRVLKMSVDTDDNMGIKKKVLRKRQAGDMTRATKKQKVEETDGVPEVAFADVNEVNNQILDVKNETPIIVEEYQSSIKGDIDNVLAALTFVTVKSDSETGITNTGSECISEK